jgi:hypothetical protein
MKSPMESSKRIILIDADVVSHFITANEHERLHLIFPDNPLYLLDKVHAELQQWPVAAVRTQISFLLGKKIRLMNFPEDDEVIKKEYAWIKNQLFKGDGESACLAVARYKKQVLASSNLKDIKNYCTMHRIDYLTTMDFLCEALRTGCLTEADCDHFISKVLAAKSKLPVTQMKDYKCRIISFL